MKVKEFAEIKNGFAFKSEKYVDSGIRVIRINNVQKGYIIDEMPAFYPLSEENNLKDYMLEKEDILMSLTGNVGRVGILSEKFLPAALNQRVACIRIDNNKVMKKYIYYAFLSKKFEQDCIKSSQGIAQKNMSTEWLKEYDINIAKIDKQYKIIEIFDELTSCINHYQSQLRNLDLLIKSRFVEMFGARLEKEQILLNEIADFTIGLTYKPENISENGTIVLRSGNIQNNSLQIVEDVVRVEGVKIPENKYIKKNDILMCSRNGSARLVGKSCLITETKEKMSFGAFMTVIRSKYPYFLQSFFNSDYFKEQLTSVATTSVNQITTYMLNGYKTIKPTDDEEKEFSDFVKQVDKSKFAVQAALNKTKMLMDSLMQEYFG